MRILLVLSACAVFLSSSALLHAGDFYVDPVNGKDVATAGTTAAKPWKTINYAIAQATAKSAVAHTFHLAKGTYVESPSSSAIPFFNVETMTFIGASTASTAIVGTFFWGPSNGIHLEALTCTGLTANTTTARPASILIRNCGMGTCSLSASKQGSYLVLITESRMRKFDINLGSSTKSSLLAKTSSFGDGGAQILGYSDAAGSVLTFEDCRFENATQDGLSALLAQSHLTIRRCVFRGAGRYGIDLRSRYDVKNGNLVEIQETSVLACGTAGIRALHDARGKKHTMHDHLLLTRCVLSQNKVGLDNSDWGLTIRDSLLSQSQGDAIQCKTTLPSHDIRIERSTIADNAGNAIALQGFDLSSFWIDNCMLTSNREGISGVFSPQSKGVQVESCTIADNTRSGISVFGMVATSLSIHHTIFGGNKVLLGFPSGSQVQYCLSDMQLLTGTGNLKSSPGFFNPSLGMYQLTSTSAAVDAGKASLIKASKDYEGDPRVINMGTTTATPDIGADEYSLLGLPHITAAATVPLGMPASTFSKMSLVRTGSNYSATLSGPRKSDGILWLMGFSERRLAPSLALPLDLVILSQAGTLLHTRIDMTFAGSRLSNGDAILTFPVPDNSALHGFPIRIQALILGKEGLGSSALQRIVIGKPQSIQEQFTNQNQLDVGSSGAAWGAGKLVPGQLGGSGIHGKFRADTGELLGVFNGIKRYLWNTDSIRIPFGQTLHGEAYWKKKLGSNKTHLVITTGKFEFSEFVLPADEAVIFRGKNTPDFNSIGDMKIDGRILLEVSKAPTASTGGKGAVGAIGSLGGASGGQGGDVPSLTGGSIQGRNGVGVVIPAGHPRAAQSAASGGRGSPANPATGANANIAYFGTGGFASRMTAAGGGGGSLWSPNGTSFLGEAGIAKSLIPSTGPTFPPHNTVDVGTASLPSKPFPVMPINTTVPSHTLFRIGGSGGGGGGTSPCGSFPSSITWISGVGGGAGGGHVHLKAGHALLAGSKAQILAQGGAGAGRSDSSSVTASGGGGSGGSVLIQSGVTPTIAGEINVLGGAGGTGTETTWLEIGSFGGKGGAGFIMIESVPAVSPITLSRFKPAATLQNVGLLRAIDHDKVTTATSKWYATKFPVRPVFHSYTLVAKVNGNTVTYSDDGKHTKAEQGQPVVLLIQSANLDPKTGTPVGPTSEWQEGTVQPLNTDKNAGDGFRFMIRLDLSVTGTKTIDVQSLTVQF